MPLERHCVRFIDNFSGGTRGALSAENFLQVSQHKCHHMQSHARHLVRPLMQPHQGVGLRRR